MKKPGLIGGVTWTSTIDYYRLINQLSNKTLGFHHTLEIMLYSVNFEEVLQMMTEGHWTAIETLFSQRALALKREGADFFAICSNTLAKVGNAASLASGLPIVDMVDSVSEAIGNYGIEKVALLGTDFAMADPYYGEALKAHGIEAVIPDRDERITIHRIIMQELAYGQLEAESRKTVLKIMERMQQDHQVAGVILGCTELPMLIKQADAEIPVFDTTAIHAAAIVNFALES